MAEAMHMAVPVIISRKVDSWSFVEIANAGFVVEEEEMEFNLVRRLDELLSTPDNARCMGKRGQDFARKHLTWQRVTQDMVSMYLGMLSE